MRMIDDGMMTCVFVMQKHLSSLQMSARCSQTVPQWLCGRSS